MVVVAVSNCSAAGMSSSWKVDQAQFEASMTLLAAVQIDGVNQQDGRLAAFVHNEIRGVADAAEPAPLGPFKGERLFALMVYANRNGEELKFKFQPSPANSDVLDLNESAVFMRDGSLGSLPSPLVLHATVQSSRSPLPRPPLPRAQSPPPLPARTNLPADVHPNTSDGSLSSWLLVALAVFVVGSIVTLCVQRMRRRKKDGVSWWGGQRAEIDPSSSSTTTREQAGLPPGWELNDAAQEASAKWPGPVAF